MKKYALLVAALVAALCCSTARADLPRCEVKNPPFAPNVIPESDIVVGQINNRCWGSTTIDMGHPSLPDYPQQVQGWFSVQVWQLGAYGCLQARRNFNQPWRNVSCEAAQVYHKAAVVLWTSHDGDRVRGWADRRTWWEWRVVGHAWVYYEAGGGVFRSQTVTSPFVPLPVKPHWARA